MSNTIARLEITIDVVGLPGQRALVLPSLTPTELVGNVLEEFREIEYLGARPGDYRLVGAPDGEPLDDGRPLSAQITPGAHLRLEERLVPLPKGGVRPSLGDLPARTTFWSGLPAGLDAGHYWACRHQLARERADRR